MMILSDYANNKAVSDAVDTGGLFEVANVGLYTTSSPVTSASTIASLAEATFGGYGRISVTWSTGIYTQPDGSDAVSSANVVEFQPTSTTGLPLTVYGYFIADGAGTPNLLAVEPLPNGPVTLTNETDAILLVPQLAYGGQSFPGTATVIE